jgi:hypothetical protein
MNARVLPLLLLAWASLGLLARPVPAAAAAPPRWGEPVAIGETIPSSWFPDIQADPAGTFRLVWTVNLAEGDGNLTHALTGAVMITELGAGGWKTPRDVRVMDAGIASRPLIASDGTYAHMLFRTGTLGTVRLFYTRAPLSRDLGNAHSWSEPQPLSDDGAYYAQLAILPDGTLIALFNALVAPAQLAGGVPAAGGADAGPPPGQRTVVVARRSGDRGETWDFPLRISASEVPIGRTALAVAPDGKTLVAAWDEGYDNLTGQGEPLGIGTAVSPDGGLSWQARQALRSPLGAVEQASVAVGADGPLVVYRATGEDRLLYRLGRDGGREWSDERPIPDAVARRYSGKHNFDKLGLARDGDGRLLLAYVGQDRGAPKGLAVMVTTFAGGTWTPPERVAAPDGYPEYPRLAVALGNQIQLVYFVRDKEFEIGHYVLYAVAGQSDARPIAPVVASPPPAATSSAPRPTLPPVRLQAAPTALPTPAPWRGQPRRERTPQAEVARPAARAIVATLLALGLIVPLIGIARLQGASRG